MKKDGKTIIKYRPMSMYVEDYLPKQKEKNKKRGKRK